MGLASCKIRRKLDAPRAIRKNSSIEIARYMPVSVPLDGAHPALGCMRV
jgi:hypothetical protein